jgi:lysophosphatidylcholine acyltransferase/lyso-PAF acetyltransferase
MIGWIIALGVHTFIVFIYSLYVYKKNYVFYRKFEYINPKTSEKESVHSLFPEFACLDKISFFRIFLGNFIIISIIKLIIDVSITIIIIIRLKQHSKKLKNPSTDKDDWAKVSETMSFWTKWGLKINGFKIIKKELPYEAVYKKYLGEDYSFDPNEKYSLIVSNHTGFFDIVLNMAVNSAGFLAKDDVQNVPFIGTIAKGINCLFVKRESKEDRERIFIELEKRQKDFYEGRLLSPLCIFPEGTTTNGKYILKLKKGAFYALLPIKPQILLFDDDVNYSPACGVSSTAFNYFRSLAYFRVNIYLCQLPVIKPTEYMWEHYAELGKEKWEIYAEVTRKIMCEIGGLKPSSKTYRDIKRYENSCYKRVYEDTSEISIPLLSN